MKVVLSHPVWNKPPHGIFVIPQALIQRQTAACGNETNNVTMRAWQT
jgi:hypothetical protein